MIAALNLSACGKKVENLPEQDISEKVETEKENGDEIEVNAGDEEIVDTDKKDTEKQEESQKAVQPDKNGDKTGSSEVPEKPKDGKFKIPDFKTVDLDGNEVTSDFFAENNLTVLSIWTTT